ncbi:MAG: Dipeptide transport system permease protein DppC [Myxococcaceae bacterium]|nr:Dipeptide transport system permease protein DppC [Myxococcaceae bacterium]
MRRSRLKLRGRLALWAVIALVLTAIAADLLAADLPLAVRLDGRTHWLPMLTRPVPLRGATQQALAVRAEWIWRTPVPWGPNQTFAANAAVRDTPPPWGPDGNHWLGTDELGRDVLARLIHGARVSLTVGLLSVALCVAIGLLLGGLAGYYGRGVDAVISRVTEIMITFPTLFFVLAVLGLLRISSLFPLVLVIGFTRWTDIARLVRAEVLKLKGLDFITASRALGLSDARILVRHLLPNALSPVLVAATFAVASAILIESALSFLGLGAPPPTASWGELLTQAHRYLTHPGAWWLAVFPGMCIAATVLALNELGEALRALLDPRA